MKFSHFLIVFSALALLSLTARAQEEIPMIEGHDPDHREVNYNEDKTLIYDQPALHQTPGIRDTVQTTTPRPSHRTIRHETPRESLKPRQEEDALRFNFLYYIIQKYKLSDLIEN